MAVNKVQVGNTVYLDLSGDTVTAAEHIMAGFVGHLANGTKVTGTGSGSGGGLPSGIAAVATGSYTVSADFTTTRQTVTHNLGVTPDLVLFFATANFAQTNTMQFSLRCTKMGYRSSAYNLYNCYHGNSTTSVSVTNSSSTTVGVSNLTSTTFQIASHSTSYYWRAGTYKWLALKFS